MSLIHVTFYLTSKIRDQELTKFQAALPNDSSIKVNRSTGIVVVGELTTIHRTMESPGQMRERLQGMRIQGYTFHDSVRTVSTDLVHWLNQEVARNNTRWTS
jgi:hypothetical protein